MEQPWLRCRKPVCEHAMLTLVFLVLAVTQSQGFQCGGNFSATSGEFFSPGYPSPYPSKLDCVYNIHVPTTSQEHFISLHFLDYDLEESANCSADYIDVFEGPELSPRSRLVRLCGNHTDLRFQTGNVLGIHFHTDAERAARGFRASWDFKERGRIAICHFGHETLLSPGTPSWVPILISVVCILIIVSMATICVRRRLAQSRAMVLERFPPFEDSESEKKISDLEAPPAYENHMAVPYSPPPYEASSSDCPPRYESLSEISAAVNESESADEKLLPPSRDEEQ